MIRYRRIIGALIRRFRLRAGISQMRLAELIGVSYQQIQKYESGRSSISVERLIQIADALRTPVTEFLPSKKDLLSEPEEPYGRLSKDERLLLELFRRIKDKQSRKAIIKIIKDIGARDH